MLREFEIKLWRNPVVFVLAKNKVEAKRKAKRLLENV